MINPPSFHELLDTIEKVKDCKFHLEPSKMKIYEEINEILAPEHRKLHIYDIFRAAIHVAGLQ